MHEPTTREALGAVWWREGRRRGVMLPHGWLFPGRTALEPISTRQLNRAVHEAAEVAGIPTAITGRRCGADQDKR